MKKLIINQTNYELILKLIDKITTTDDIHLIEYRYTLYEKLYRMINLKKIINNIK